MAQNDNTPSGGHSTKGSDGSLSDRDSQAGFPSGKVGNVGKPNSMGGGTSKPSGEDRY